MCDKCCVFEENGKFFRLMWYGKVETIMDKEEHKKWHVENFYVINITFPSTIPYALECKTCHHPIYYIIFY